MISSRMIHDTVLYVPYTYLTVRSMRQYRRYEFYSVNSNNFFNIRTLRTLHNLDLERVLCPVRLWPLSALCAQYCYQCTVAL